MNKTVFRVKDKSLYEYNKCFSTNQTEVSSSGFWCLDVGEGNSKGFHFKNLEIVSTTSIDVAMKHLKTEMWAKYLSHDKSCSSIGLIYDVSLSVEFRNKLFRISGNGLRTPNELIEEIYFKEPKCEHNWRVLDEFFETRYSEEYLDLLYTFECIHCGEQRKDSVVIRYPEN